MAVEVLLPKLTDEMEEGTVSRWLKQVGDAVKKGEPLVEVETEKVIVEVEAAADGVLLEIVAAEQQVVPVLGVLCLIGQPGEKVAARPVPSTPPAKPAPEAVSSDVVPSNVVPLVQRETAMAGEAAPEPVAPTGAEGLVTPLARRVAQELGIDLTAVKGTGIGGKIIMSDLQPFLGSEVPIRPASPPQRSAAQTPPTPPKAVPEAPPSPAAAGRGGVEEVPLSAMRGTVARRMSESKREIPHFYMTAEIDFSGCLALRKRLNAKLDDGKITVNDLMIKAAAGALAKVPELNGEFRQGVLRRFSAVHMGFAVAMEGGLLTPVVRDCQQKSLAAIARETRDLAARARERKLRPEELQGGTFTISNLGMYDVTEFAAIINPPQVGILAIAKPVERPVVKNGWVVVSSRLNATLSADHRAVDGVTGAAFLEALKRELEDPERLLL